MGFVWNKELKRLAVFFCTIFFVGMILTNFCMEMYGNRMREQYYGLLASLFGNVLTAYPDVTEEELIRVLNGYQEKNGCQERDEYQEKDGYQKSDGYQEKNGYQEKDGYQERDRYQEKSGYQKSSLGAEVLAQYGLLQDYGSASFTVLRRQTASLYASVNALLFLLFLTCGLLLFFYLRERQRRISGLADYMEGLNRNQYRLDVEDNLDDELTGLRNEVYKTTVLLREQADRAGRQRRTLADSVADISHQLKTPLTSMTILVDNLSEDADMDQDTRRHFMSEISRQLTGMSWLVTTMLKLARLDAGVVELERARLNVKELLEEVLGRLEIAAEWSNVSFSVDIPEDAEINGDRKWTGEALMNIIKNAIEHSPQGGEVEISGEENDVYTKIEISDHGRGIAEEERRRLFERFYRGPDNKEDSTGIGLSLAKEIVEKQGGYISVEAAQGEGCVFILKFTHMSASADINSII